MKLIQKIIRFLIRRIRKTIRIVSGKKLGISYLPPNYVYINKLSQNSIVVDVGCADDPDFSINIIKKYNCKCYGIDPTRKHFAALEIIESVYKDRFTHLPYAVANKNGTLIFHESQNNVSGSILTNHINIIQDNISSYEVETLNIMELKRKVSGENGKIDFMKLDIEGAEYDLFDNPTSKDFDNIDQLFIEFHHHCIKGKNQIDTDRVVNKIKDFNFKVFTLDDKNFLFYR